MALLIGEIIRRNAAVFPDRVAATMDAASLSYRELETSGNATARALAAMGIGRGDRVVCWADTCLEVLPLFVGLAKLGAVFAPMNARLGAGEAAEVLPLARASLLPLYKNAYEIDISKPKFPNFSKIMHYFKLKIGLAKKYGVKKILTQCPHCFNTFKNEYPQLAGNYEVIHHTEFIAELIKDGKINPKNELNADLTYHDSCYMGRHNGVYDSPRDALSAIPGITLTEMPRSRENGFCCGAGGGRMWLEESMPKVNQERVNEAGSINADTIATGCPFCKTMIRDGINETGVSDSMKTVDIAQLVADSL